MVKRVVVFVLLTMVSIIVGFTISTTLFSSTVYAPNNENNIGFKEKDTVTVSEVFVEPKSDIIIPAFDSSTIKDEVNNWLASLPKNSVAAVSIMDVNSDVLASHLADKKFYSASIYKLFVAYEGYKMIDAGTVKGGEVYSGGHTRLECLDLMIRLSDSPCAEKLLLEIGNFELDKRIANYGLKNTSMISFETTSHDTAIFLNRILRGDDLSINSRALLLGSMKDQIYKDALKKGFSDAVEVYDKVGFRDYIEYHDVAIVKFADNRELIIAVFSENVGTRRISRLAQQIEKTVI